MMKNLAQIGLSAASSTDGGTEFVLRSFSLEKPQFYRDKLKVDQSTSGKNTVRATRKIKKFYGGRKAIFETF